MACHGSTLRLSKHMASRTFTSAVVLTALMNVCAGKLQRRWKTSTTAITLTFESWLYWLQLPYY